MAIGSGELYARHPPLFVGGDERLEPPFAVDFGPEGELSGVRHAQDGSQRAAPLEDEARHAKGGLVALGWGRQLQQPVQAVQQGRLAGPIGAHQHRQGAERGVHIHEALEVLGVKLRNHVDLPRRDHSARLQGVPAVGEARAGRDEFKSVDSSGRPGAHDPTSGQAWQARARREMGGCRERAESRVQGEVRARRSPNLALRASSRSLRRSPQSLWGRRRTLRGGCPKLAEQAPNLAGTPPDLAGKSRRPAGRRSHLAGKSPGPAGQSPKPAGQSPKPAGQSPKPAGKSSNLAGKSSNLAGKSSNLAGKSPRLAGSPPGLRGRTPGRRAAIRPRRERPHFSPCVMKSRVL
jgi:hypothetical protein